MRGFQTQTKRKAHANGYAGGGMVRGPGTGISDDVPDQVPEGTYIMPADSTAQLGPDKLAGMGARGFKAGGKKATGGKSVPVNLSNGEFKLPPEQVHAVGVQALDQIKNATHKPVRGFAPQAVPEQPRQFFANGGYVKRLHLADAGVVTQKRLEEEGQVPNAAPPAVAAPATQAQLRGLYQDWQDKKVPWYMPTPRGNMEERTAEAAYTKALAGSYAGGGLQHQPGGWPPASQAQTTTQDAAPGATTPATATLNSALEAQRRRDAIAGKNTDQNTTPQPSNTPSTEAQAPQGREVVPGAYAHGRGQYSDNAQGMGFAPGFTGQPSAQNMAAADALSARSQQESMARVTAQPAAGFQPAGVTAPTVRHSGNDWQARNDLRNAQVSASSIMNNGGKWDQHKGVSPERAYAAALEGADIAARGAQPGVDVAAMRENAGIQREGMQQSGATARAQMQEAGQNSRFGQTQDLAQQKFGMEREAQGFTARAAAQSEQLRNTLLDPKSTPEQRSIAQRNLAALSGKTAADRMQTVALPDTTTDTGQVVRGGQALVRTLEDGTVVQVPVGAAQQGGAQPLPPGVKRQVGTSNGRPVYEDMNGKRVIAKG